MGPDVHRSSAASQDDTKTASHWPEEAVEVAVPHVLEHHGERFSIRAHAVEADDVLMLEHGQELGLALEVLSSRLVGVLQRLDEKKHFVTLSTMSRISYKLLLYY